MDNAGSHRNIIVKEKITKSKNTLLYSVPYRPKTNAVESWFSQFKHYFKLDSSHLSFNALKTAVHHSD